MRSPRAVRAWLADSLTCTASVFWELAEFLSDRYSGTRGQGGRAHTMGDMLIDVLGALAIVAAWTVMRRWRAR